MISFTVNERGKPMHGQMEASPVKAARHPFFNDCSLSSAGNDYLT